MKKVFYILGISFVSALTGCNLDRGRQNDEWSVPGVKETGKSGSFTGTGGETMGSNSYGMENNGPSGKLDTQTTNSIALNNVPASYILGTDGRIIDLNKINDFHKTEVPGETDILGAEKQMDHSSVKSVP
jgi:hypothetical protein